jgi:dolichyl-phosphate beta-glucosyltransferase
MTLSIVIPAYNEELRLPKTLEHIVQFFNTKYPPCSLKEILVVDDGSTDRTAALVHEWREHLPIRCIRLSKNCGKGAAVREGVLASHGEYVLSYDADGATPIGEVRELLAALREKHADIAVGSRRAGEKPSVRAMQWHRRILSDLYYRLCMLLVPEIQDAACGCKLFQQDVARHLFSLQKIDRFAFDLEVLSLAKKCGYSLVEVPVQWNAIAKSKVRIFRDGMEMFYQLLRLYLQRFLP